MPNTQQLIQSTDNRVIDAYIPTSDDLVEEIWMEARELENWKSLLRPLFHNIQNKPVEQQKREFTRLLMEELQRILGKPLIQGATLADMVNSKGGLPVREHSPLMQYTVTEIRQMQKCEFNRLVKWVENIYRVLNNVTGSPTVKVSYSLADFPESQCSRVSPKGQNIQRLTLEGAQPLGPDDNHSYLHDFRKGQTIYSIPKDFLP